MSATPVPLGLQGGGPLNSPYLMFRSIVELILGTKHHATLVQVQACTSSGGVALAGTVDVLPLVNQLDGNGNAWPHEQLYKLPYFRIQGGANAVIMDPAAGDVGLAIFCDRDISSVVAAVAQGIDPPQANPGSGQRNSMGFGLYLGGFLNAAPTQYVQFSAAGITLVSPTLVKLQAPDVQLVAPTIELNASTSVTVTTPLFTVNGVSQFNGNVGVAGSMNITIQLTVNGIAYTGHTHPVSGIATGTSTVESGGPTG